MAVTAVKRTEAVNKLTAAAAQGEIDEESSCCPPPVVLSENALPPETFLVILVLPRTCSAALALTTRPAVTSGDVDGSLSTSKASRSPSPSSANKEPPFSASSEGGASRMHEKETMDVVRQMMARMKTALGKVPTKYE